MSLRWDIRFPMVSGRNGGLYVGGRRWNTVCYDSAGGEEERDVLLRDAGSAVLTVY
jgi:hypothetical protein